MAGKSVTGFQADLKKFARTVNIDVGKVRRRIALDLYDRITRKTPVGNPKLWQTPVKGYVGGRLRASWFLSDGRPSRDMAPDGAMSYPPKGDVTSTFTDPFEVSWIVNNLPYAAKIEFEGHSKQAPSGMVRVSLAEVEAGLLRALGRL